MSRAAWLGAVLPAALAGVLAAQGWRGSRPPGAPDRAPTIDHVPLFDDARQAVANGTLPDRSCLASYGAFLPPGPSWLCLPGAALGLDSRLLELPGALLMHCGAAAGVWLLAGRCFGRAAAAAAAWAYCLSDLGLFYASSLWPRGPACAAAWFAYCLARWAGDRDGRWLAWSAVPLAWGAVVFLELAPLAAAVPFVWLRTKPPLRSKAWLLALPLALLPWLPYAKFQAERGFADLLALVQRRGVPLPDPLPSFCDPQAQVVNAAGLELWPNPAPAAAASGQATTSVGGIPAGVWAGLRGNLPADAGAVRLAGWWALLAAGFVAHRRSGGSTANPGAGAVWRALLIPWALLLAMAERDPSADRRFWWLWPLHAAAAAAGAAWLAGWIWGRWTSAANPAPHPNPPPEAGGGDRFASQPHIGASMFAVLAVLALAATAGRPAERVADWRRHGFAGEDSPAWAILRTLAEDAQARGLKQVRVSHSVLLWAHAFKFHPLDARYRVGMELDLVLRDDFGLANAAGCPEGVCPAADYVVEEKDLAARFPPRLGKDYQILAENRQYRLHRRK